MAIVMNIDVSDSDDWNPDGLGFVCFLLVEQMEVEEAEEAGGFHQILEFFETCANLITTLARWIASSPWIAARVASFFNDSCCHFVFVLVQWNVGATNWSNYQPTG